MRWPQSFQRPPVSPLLASLREKIIEDRKLLMFKSFKPFNHFAPLQSFETFDRLKTTH